MRNLLVLGSLVLSAATAGCFGHAGAYAEGDAPVVFSAPPTLVAVEPDVWVARDSDYAVYYVDDYYWVDRDDVWYRSRAYDGGWATVEMSVVPRVIVSRDQRAYVHYRGAPNAPTRPAPRERGDARELAGRADERRQAPPGRDKDSAPRPPQRPDERHDAPAGRPPQRPDEHHDAPADRPPQRPDEHHDAAPDRDRRDAPRPNEQRKPDQGRPDQAGPDKGRPDQGRPDKDEHKRGDNEQGHEKK